MQGWSDDDFSRLMLDIELSVEKHVQQPCSEVVDVLKSIKAHGCKTVLISDFYLPSPYFGQMLAHHQLNDWFDHLYISADCGLAKGFGTAVPKGLRGVGLQP